MFKDSRVDTPDFVPVFESLAQEDFNASAIKKPANETDIIEVMEKIITSKGLRVQFRNTMHDIYSE